MNQQQFKYFAFISYNSKDTEWGKRLQRKLEHYRMPAILCSKHGWERRPIKPVFFWTFGRICNPVAVNISIFNAKMRHRQDLKSLYSKRSDYKSDRTSASRPNIPPK